MERDESSGGWKIDPIQKPYEQQLEELELNAIASKEKKKKNGAGLWIVLVLALAMAGFACETFVHLGDSLQVPTTCSLDVTSDQYTGSHFTMTCQARGYALHDPYFQYLGIEVVTVFRIPI